MTTINHECYVSLEVAKLLKKAGFDWKCRGIYVLDSENDPEYVFSTANFTNTSKEIEGYIRFSAPTLEVAQRWLREVKRYFVEVNYDDCQKHYWVELFINEDDGGGIPFYGNVFAMFEEAQESGIKKSLELILEKGE